jgi:tight adherence protein C
MFLILLLGIVSFALAAFLLGEVATLPARQREGSIRRAASYGEIRRPTSGLQQESFRDRAIAPASTALARVALRLNPQTTVESISLKLLGAGLGRKVSPTTYLASKVLLGGAGIPLGAILGGAAGKSGALSILLMVVFGAIGFVIPDMVVGMKARSRKDQIRAELPDALDLLAVSVEAGMGFDGAIAKLTEHMSGPLVEEFALTLGEMRIGESRENALRKMADRVSIPELAAFTRAIIQADQLGISLGRILRVQATDTRNKRQAAAEERAMKAPIKMLFPTVMFIFPAMFVVILGPAFLNLGKLFGF